jgi:hypothetical protein
VLPALGLRTHGAVVSANCHGSEREPVKSLPSPPAASEPPRLLTVPEAAAILNTSPDAVYAALRRLQLPPDLIVRPLGMRTIRIREDRLLAHIEASTEAPEIAVPEFVRALNRRKKAVAR